MELITQIAGLLKGYPIPESWLIPLVRIILVLALLMVAGVVHWLAKGIFLKQIKRFAEYTKYQVDNILFENRVFHRLADFLPVLIIYIFLPEILEDSPLEHFRGSSGLHSFNHQYCTDHQRNFERPSRDLPLFSVRKKYFNQTLHSGPENRIILHFQEYSFFPSCLINLLCIF